MFFKYRIFFIKVDFLIIIVKDFIDNSKNKFRVFDLV